MTCNENAIFRGDDTDAFGQNWLTINAVIPTGWVIAKADVKIGDLPIKTFNNPVFPLSINLTNIETIQLSQKNNIYMKVYDTQGRGMTCQGTLSFPTQAEVV